MKTFKLLSFTIMLSFFISCDKEEVKNYTDLIIGNWTIQEVTFNNTNGTDINDWISASTVLNFEEDESYYRNYVNGNWFVDGNQLKLIPRQELQLTDWNYEILQLTENTLKVKIELTESEYCCDFESFESTDVLTIVESYKRED